MTVRAIKPEEYFIEEEPYYEPVGDELTVFAAAYKNQLRVLLKGPTGCGKTRFMEHMAWRLKLPLITVSCHDDLTASDLVGRYLITGGETVWVDGPLARAVRNGTICNLNEIVEARKDTTVVIHPLADDRRVLPMEKLGEVLEAGPEFCMAISCNPRLPERAQGPQAIHAAALRGTGVRLPVRKTGSEDPGERNRGRRGNGRAAHQVRADDQESQGQWPGRERQYTVAGACRKADRRWREPGGGVPVLHRRGANR
jgi:hypothetical protein